MGDYPAATWRCRRSQGSTSGSRRAANAVRRDRYGRKRTMANHQPGSSLCLTVSNSSSEILGGSDTEEVGGQLLPRPPHWLTSAFTAPRSPRSATAVTRPTTSHTGDRTAVQERFTAYQGESWMLDSSEDVYRGQARFEYPATSVLFSNFPSMDKPVCSPSPARSNGTHAPGTARSAPSPPT